MKKILGLFFIFCSIVVFSQGNNTVGGGSADSLQWSRNGIHIFNKNAAVNGNVGIRIANPLLPLHVHGGGVVGVNAVIPNVNLSFAPSVLNIVSPTQYTANAVTPNETAFRIIRAGLSGSIFNGAVDFSIGKVSATSAATRMTIGVNNGNTHIPDVQVATFTGEFGGAKVGIGTISPKYMLHLLSGTSIGIPAAGNGIINSQGGSARFIQENNISAANERAMLYETNAGYSVFSSLSDNYQSFVQQNIMSMRHNTGFVGFGGLNTSGSRVQIDSKVAGQSGLNLWQLRPTSPKTAGATMGVSADGTVVAVQSSSVLTAVSATGLVAGQIPNQVGDVVTLQTFNSSYTTPIIAPIGGEKIGQRLVIRCNSGFPITIPTTNTNMATPLVLTEGQVGTWTWGGLNWIWENNTAPRTTNFAYTKNLIAADWTLVGTFYTTVVPAATHGMGTLPIASLEQVQGSAWNTVTSTQLKTADGGITFISSTPTIGRVIIK